MRAVLVQHLLEHSVRRYPNKTALVTNGGRYTYSDVDGMANALAEGLIGEGMSKGDRVAVMLENSLESVLAVFGILKAGGVFVFVNPTTKAAKLAQVLSDCGASLVISSRLKQPVLAAACAAAPSVRRLVLTGERRGRTRKSGPSLVPFGPIIRNPQPSPPTTGTIDTDLAALIYTSGTTGVPKGVMMTHLSMMSVSASITEMLGNSADDIILNILPMSFDYGLYQVLMGFKVGGTVVLEHAFLYPAAVMRRLVEERVTGFPIVPTIASILLSMEGARGQQFEDLRYITSTAAFLPVEHIMGLRRLFPQAKLYSMYGLTECKRVSYLEPAELDKRPTSVGKSIPNTEAYVVDSRGAPVGAGVIGELVVRGSHVMRGYWNDPKETAKRLKPGPYSGERVLFTGDLFRTDEEGFLYFVGRKDDLIKSRGEKVSPKEVEAVLYALEGVAEAAVVGVADPVLGHAVKALVVLKPSSALTTRQVIRHCAQHLEDFMVPKYVEFVRTLPRTAQGKLDKRRLLKEGHHD